MEFKDKLRKLRNDAGLSQEALADIVHISRSAIAKYENGNGNPSEETLKALAFYFGVDVSELRSDNVIKKENRKKKIIKSLTIFGSIFLISGIVTASILGAINLNNKDNNSSSSGLEGDSMAKLTGAYSDVELLRLNDEVPENEYSNEKYYVTNTFLLFRITIHPTLCCGSTPMVFSGDMVKFDSQDFAYIYYDYTHEEETSYIIEFKKEGTFELFYSIMGFDKSIKFICDDNSQSWDQYKTKMSAFYPWINNVKKEDITSLRYEYMNSSIGPNHFRDIYYSCSEIDIENAFDFLSETLYFSNSNNQKPGTGSKTITYYLKGYISESISLYDNNISITSSIYTVNNLFSIPKEYNEHRYGFNTYGNNIKAVNLNDNSEYNISYFYDLEFIEWPIDEDYENVEPIYTIIGYPGEDINIYSQDRFSYLEKMYKIVSEQNYYNLFN